MRQVSLLSLLLLFCLFGCNLEDEVLTPNIILILADDLGTGDVNAYNPDSRIPTPNMDRIAQDGIRFTDAHSGSAVCTPTRYGIITGRYCWRTRLKKGVLNGYSDHLIDPEKTTIASLLQGQGYFTAGIGKWHLGMDFPKDSAGEIDYSGEIMNSPNVNGFDYFYGIPASLDFPPYVYIENDKFPVAPTKIQERLNFPRYLRKGPKASNFDFETAWEHLLTKAQKVIDDQHKEGPFFLYFALPSPHKPVWPDSRFKSSTELGPYGDFVHQTDYIIGKIIQTIEEKGIRENTLLMVTSDNGSFMYGFNDTIPEDHLLNEAVQGYYPKNHTANYNYRGTKADVWEGGHRIPFLVQWPQNIKGGVSCEETICTTDFMATIAELTGIELSSDEGEDSFSFLPLLLDTKDKFSRAPVINHSSSGMFAIRSGDYKLILGNGSGGRQVPRGKVGAKPYMLFNLGQDISESNNIIDSNQEMAQEMENILQRIIDSGNSKNY